MAYVEGNFPFWLSVDSRLIGDEFFRNSYTDGVGASGNLGKKLTYQSMIGDNNGVLGVSAAPTPELFKTTANSLVWMPTTGEFGSGWGDFEDHQKVATRFGGHSSYSKEDAQEQPNTEAFENTQLRLSDGSIIFTLISSAMGSRSRTRFTKMVSLDFGIKYHGYSRRVLPTASAKQLPGHKHIALAANSDYTAIRSRPPRSQYKRRSQGCRWIRSDWELYGRPWDFRAVSIIHSRRSRPVEHRVSLHVQIPSRLHIGSLRAWWHWSNLPHNSQENGFLEGRGRLKLESTYEITSMKYIRIPAA